MQAIPVALTAQRSLGKAVETLAYNVANANTTAFRASQSAFRTIQSTVDSKPVSFVDAVSSHISKAGGSLAKTDNTLDVALSAEHWLGVDSGVGLSYSKAGRLNISPAGVLQTMEGMPVVDEGGAAILVDPAGGNLDIRPNGLIMQNGVTVGTLGLFRIPAEAELERLTPLVFRSSIAGDASGPADLRGSVQQGYLESSNVSPMLEMTNLILTQRLFDDVTSMIQICEAAESDAIKGLVGRG